MAAVRLPRRELKCTECEAIVHLFHHDLARPFHTEFTLYRSHLHHERDGQARDVDDIFHLPCLCRLECTDDEGRRKPVALRVFGVLRDRCCTLALASALLPDAALEEAELALRRRCRSCALTVFLSTGGGGADDGERPSMAECTAECCGHPASDCLHAVLDLCERYRRVDPDAPVPAGAAVCFDREEYRAFKSMVTGRGRYAEPLDYWDVQETLVN